MRGLIVQAVQRPVGVVVMCLAVLVIGAVSLRNLTIDLLPDVDVPWITITTEWEGVSPQEIETLLTRPIEQATSTVENVDRIEASSSEGLSRVQLQFGWGTSVETALDDVRVALDRIRRSLPEEAATPSIYKFDLASVPVMHLAVSGNADTRRLKFLAEEDLARALERLGGVASVDTRGGRDREIRVALDAERLAAQGLAAAQVEAALARENRTLSAGDMRATGREVVIRTEGEFASLDDIESTVVDASGPRPITVGDVATVQDTIREVKSELWIDGEPSIELRVFKQSGANTVAVAERVEREVERLNRDYAGRAQLRVMWNSADYIEAAIDGVKNSALIGAALAIVILLFFLRSLRATLVVALAIPLSVVATFSLVYLRGMTLNVISFGGLALGIGLLVDAAVVILESIHQRRSQAGSAREAAIEGAHDVATAVLAGTLTTIAVFAPVVFVGGFAGVLFGEMALVVTFALGCSLLVALAVVPMLSGVLLARSTSKQRAPTRLASTIDGWFRALERHYRRLLVACLAAPWAVVVAAMSLLGASAVFATEVAIEVMPEADEGLIDADLDFPVGTPLETTTALIREAERRVIEQGVRPEELLHVMTSAGPEAWWRPGGANEGEIELMLVPSTARERSVSEIEPDVRRALADIPGARLRVRPRSNNLLTRLVQRGEDRLGVEILGHDLATGDRLAREVVAMMNAVPGISYARPERQLGQLERVLHVDRKRAAEFGLGSSDVAESVERYVLGRVPTRYREQGDEFDIRVVLDDAQRRDLSQLGSLPLFTPTGQLVTLEQVARMEQRHGPSTIERVDQERVLEVNAGSSGRALQDIAADLRQGLSSIEVPDGFTLRLSGELAAQDDTFLDLLIGLLLALFLVYAVMAIQFESFRHPFVIMLSVPFAFTGVIGMLIATGTSLNVYSFLGAIVLVGIVVNNAILLVSHANDQVRRYGRDTIDALLDAGQRRLRPILMTTSTTLLGLLPLCIGYGEGSEMQAPLARAIVGGLTTSTLVTLVLVPAVYVLIDAKNAERPPTATRQATFNTTGGSVRA